MIFLRLFPNYPGFDAVDCFQPVSVAYLWVRTGLAGTLFGIRWVGRINGPRAKWRQPRRDHFSNKWVPSL